MLCVILWLTGKNGLSHKNTDYMDIVCHVEPGIDTGCFRHCYINFGDPNLSMPKSISSKIETRVKHISSFSVKSAK